MMVMIGIAIGTGAGMVLALMIDTLAWRVCETRSRSRRVGIRCLGLVPKLKRFRGNRLQLPGPQRKIVAATLLQPQKTRFGQAIRSVELKLLSFDRRRDPQVVLVTAALPDEGKTWVAASLAASLAADGFSVVLVDCDLYRPTLHRMFDGLRGPGLTDYFAGGVALEEIVHNHPAFGGELCSCRDSPGERRLAHNFHSVTPVDRSARRKIRVHNSGLGARTRSLRDDTAVTNRSKGQFWSSSGGAHRRRSLATRRCSCWSPAGRKSASFCRWWMPSARQSSVIQLQGRTRS